MPSPLTHVQDRTPLESFRAALSFFFLPFGLEKLYLDGSAGVETGLGGKTPASSSSFLVLPVTPVSSSSRGRQHPVSINVQRPRPEKREKKKKRAFVSIKQTSDFRSASATYRRQSFSTQARRKVELPGVGQSSASLWQASSL